MTAGAQWIFEGCFHCEDPNHWESSCPLLKPPKDKDEHNARFERVMERFFANEISPHAKQRVIAKENAMWDKVRKGSKTK